MPLGVAIAIADAAGGGRLQLYRELVYHSDDVGVDAYSSTAD